VRELANIITEIIGKQPEVIYNVKNDGGPSRMCADISKAREKLNFHPLTPLEVGLQNTYEKDLLIKAKNSI
jgi:nucleoside-diphosphate-sugar epimerase